ncbi:hypothetical protein BG004_003540, partial [Podila humilis]
MTFEDDQDARTAVASSDGFILNGRVLTVSFAKSKKGGWPPQARSQQREVIERPDNAIQLWTTDIGSSRSTRQQAPTRFFSHENNIPGRSQISCRDSDSRSHSHSRSLSRGRKRNRTPSPESVTQSQRPSTLTRERHCHHCCLHKREARSPTPEKPYRDRDSSPQSPVPSNKTSPEHDQARAFKHQQKPSLDTLQAPRHKHKRTAVMLKSSDNASPMMGSWPPTPEETNLKPNDTDFDFKDVLNLSEDDEPR